MLGWAIFNMQIKRLFSTTALSGLLFVVVQTVSAEPIDNNTTLQAPNDAYVGFDGSVSDKRSLFFRRTSGSTDVLTGSIKAGTTSSFDIVQSWNGVDAFDALTGKLYLSALSSSASINSNVDITLYLSRQTSAAADNLSIDAVGLWSETDDEIANAGSILIDAAAGDTTSSGDAPSSASAIGIQGGEIQNSGDVTLWARGGNAATDDDADVSAEATGLQGTIVENSGKISVTAIAGTSTSTSAGTSANAQAYGIRGEQITNRGKLNITASAETGPVKAYGISSPTIDLNTGGLKVSAKSTTQNANAYGISGATETNSGDILISATSQQRFAYTYGIQGNVGTNTGVIDVESSSVDSFAYAHGIQGNTQKNSGRIRAEATATNDFAYSFGIQNGAAENAGDIQSTARSTKEQAYAYSIQGDVGNNTGDLISTSVSEEAYAYAYGVQGNVTANSGVMVISATASEHAYAYGLQGDTSTNSGALTVSATSTNDYAQAYGISGAVNINEGAITAEAIAGTDNYSTFARAYGLHRYQRDSVPDNITSNSGNISVAAQAGATHDMNGNIEASAKAYGIFLEAYNSDDPIYGTIAENRGDITTTATGAQLTASSETNTENGRVEAVGILANVGDNIGNITVTANGSSVTGASNADLITKAYGIQGDVSTNSGRIWVKAVAGTSDGSTVRSYVQATGIRGEVGINNGDIIVHGESAEDYVQAYGIDTYKGDLTANTGSIDVTGISVADSVQASGIDLFEGDIVTNSGTINVYGQSEQRYVQATGIDVYEGSIETNTGDISACGVSKESYVQATGMDITGGNLGENTGKIFAKAVSEQDDARAKGIDGKVDTNRGDVTSIAVSQADYSRAYGIYDYNGGSTPSTLSENTGDIQALAQSGDITETDKDIDGTADAYGIYLAAHNSNDPIYGSITKNSGDIRVIANGGVITGTSNTHNVDATVKAYGIQASTTENTGDIYVEANGATGKNLSDGSLLARAFGIQGDVGVNSGNITVLSRAGTIDTGAGNTGAYAYGIDGATGLNTGQIHVESHSEDFVYATGLNDAVSLVNQGKVTALAVSKGDFVYATGIEGAEVTENTQQVKALSLSETRFAYAYGIRANVGQNSGNIIAQAISGIADGNSLGDFVYSYGLNGNLGSNSATITAQATSYGDRATAYGVEQASGTLTNTGTISARAQSVLHGGTNAKARAYGVYLQNDLILDSQGLILASASGDADSEAYQVYTDGFDLSITNYGVVLASDLQLTDYEGTIQSNTGDNVTFDDAALYVYVDPADLQEGGYTLPSLVENKTLTEGQFEDLANINLLRAQLGSDWTVEFEDQTATAGEQKITFNFAPESSSALISAVATRQMALNLQDQIDGQKQHLKLNGLKSPAQSKQAYNSYASAPKKAESQTAIAKVAPLDVFGDGFEKTTQLYMQGSVSQQAANYDPVSYKSRSQGLLIGLNSSVTDNILVGVSGYYGHGKLDFSGAGFDNASEDIKNYAVGTQISYHYGSTLLGLSSLYTHSDNEFANTTSTGSRAGSFTTSTLSTRLSVMYDAELVGNHFTPEVALTHVWLNQDGFAASGTSSLDTRYSAVNDNDLYLSANLAWARNFDLGDWTVQPNAKVGVLHALTDNEVEGEIYQAGGVEELSFGADRTYLNTSVGFTLSRGNLTALVTYAGSFSGNTSRDTVQGRASYKF
ncbi:hypothetical protein PsW64_02198 [Pseudovibrio sp. W64]|nr:hypothetical protein PsW64_02198 [Pseudovibrio sp. W64]